MQSPFFIGIGGPTASGKSMLARRLNDHLPREKTGFLSMDRYYHDANAFPLVIKGNYDHPDSLDSALLIRNLRELKKGKTTAIPVYDFSTHTRSGFAKFDERPIIIVEGLLLFTFESLRELIDASIYIDAPADIRLARRILRDCSERGRTYQSVIHQYLNTVAPMHDKYVEPFKNLAQIEISGLLSPDAMTDQALAFLKRFKAFATVQESPSAS